MKEITLIEFEAEVKRREADNPEKFRSEIIEELREEFTVFDKDGDEVQSHCFRCSDLFTCSGLNATDEEEE